MKIKHHILYILFVAGSLVKAQTIDSLRQILKSAKHDTTRSNILNMMVEFESNDAIWPKFNHELKILCEKNLSKSTLNKTERNTFKRNYSDALHTCGYIEYLKYDSKAIDYLEKALQLREELADKRRIASTLGLLAESYSKNKQSEKAIACYNKDLKILKELGDDATQAIIYGNLGIEYDHHNKKYNEALAAYENALRLHEKTGNKVQVAQSYGNIGTIYSNTGRIALSLEYHQQAIKIWRSINDQQGLANALNEMGVVHYFQGDTLSALKYFTECLNIEKTIKYKLGIARSLNNIGNIYKDRKDTASALMNFRESFKIYEELGDKVNLASSLNNIGIVFHNSGELKKATYYYTKSLELAEQINDKADMGSVLSNLGRIYLKQKNYPKALKTSLRALKLNTEVSALPKIQSSALNLNKIYYAIGNYEKALVYYHLFVKMRDSMNNEESRKASIKSLFRYEYEKKASADSISHAKENELKNVVIEKKEAELDGQRKTQYVLYGGLSLVMIFAGFMFNRFKITQKQKTIIELKEKETLQQKHIIEEKQKEILDSINYARRIQQAQLPTEKYFEKNLDRLNKTNS